ncbi:hypothetical protein ATK78_3608 [Pedobacter metabolipauper]|uniref:Uncharacterized protein n=1 Tax=Pedobacter metabolipauper TaxID=425513 RepID=A0A4R6SRB9_9SPHI|nr:hypothetical protein ATK78_3608 [Pedobacter metabolipauper]
MNVDIEVKQHLKRRIKSESYSTKKVEKNEGLYQSPSFKTDSLAQTGTIRTRPRVYN